MKTIACCGRNLARVLLGEILCGIGDSLRQMGELSGGELYQLQFEDRLNEPKLTQWDARGNRVDQIELTPLWRHAERIAAEHDVVTTAYEQKWRHCCCASFCVCRR